MEDANTLNQESKLEADRGLVLNSSGLCKGMQCTKPEKACAVRGRVKDISWVAAGLHCNGSVWDLGFRCSGLVLD